MDYFIVIFCKRLGIGAFINHSREVGVTWVFMGLTDFYFISFFLSVLAGGRGGGGERKGDTKSLGSIGKSP